MMQFGSVCSGIEAASVAWSPLGWKSAFFSEIDKFPCNLLGHHYPDVPNFGDMTKFKEWADVAIDLLVGGTPCQSFSVAGLRKGLRDPRGNLALTYLAVAERYQPRWIVWENVPGVLSSNKGQDFGAFIGGLAELGYGWAYRVLDAQYCRVDGFPRAVPQSRRRVFVVGHLGDWRSAAAVLFDAKSLRRDPAPRRETGENAGSNFGEGAEGCDPDGWPKQVTSPLNAAFGSKLGLEDQHALGDASLFVPGVAKARLAKSSDSMSPDLETYVTTVFSCKDYGEDAQADVTPTLRAIGLGNSHQNAGGQLAVAYPLMSGMAASSPRLPQEQGALVPDQVAVRRLMPIECERLQGFPDKYTLVPHTHGKLAADGPRYKALGNSMAVNVMRVLGARIQMIDDILMGVA